MGYQLVKAIHLVAVFTFVGGLLVQTLCLWALKNEGGKQQAAHMLSRVQTWDRSMTNLSLLLLWAAGLYLGLSTGLFQETWLQLKLGFVIFLSAVHGAQSGVIRRSLNNRADSKKGRSFSPYLLVFAFAAIALLLAFRP